MNILRERPLRRTSVVDSSKIHPLSVINDKQKPCTVSLPFLMTPHTVNKPLNEFVFHWSGLHIKSPSDYWASEACTETILSHLSLRVCWSGNLTYIFIHQPGHGSVLYWTKVITVRNIRQPVLVDRTSVCKYVIITTVLCQARVAIKKLNRILLICVCWLLMRELFVVSSLGT